MSASKRVVAASGALAVLAGVAGCQRGCLATWFRDHLGTPGRSTEAPLATDPPACPGGIARCQQGIVTVSRSNCVSQSVRRFQMDMPVKFWTFQSLQARDGRPERCEAWASGFEMKPSHLCLATSSIISWAGLSLSFSAPLKGSAPKTR